MRQADTGRGHDVERQLLTMMHREQVARRLRITREALGDSRRDWLGRYGLSPSKLSMWEDGKIYPDLQFLMRLCEDFGLTTDWFYRGLHAGVTSSLAEALWEASAGRSAASPARVRRVLVDG